MSLQIVIKKRKKIKKQYSFELIVYESRTPTLKWPDSYYTKFFLNSPEMLIPETIESWVDRKNARQIVSFNNDENVRLYSDGKSYNIFYGSTDKILNNRLCGYQTSKFDYIVLPPEYLFIFVNTQIINGRKMDIWGTSINFKKLNIVMTLVTFEHQNYSIPYQLYTDGYLGIFGGNTQNRFNIFFKKFEVRDSIRREFVSNFRKNLTCIPEMNHTLTIGIRERKNNYDRKDFTDMDLIFNEGSENYTDNNFINYPKNGYKIDLNLFTRNILENRQIGSLKDVLYDLQEKLENIREKALNYDGNDTKKAYNFVKMLNEDLEVPLVNQFPNWRGNNENAIIEVKIDNRSFPNILYWGDDAIPDYYKNIIQGYLNGTMGIPFVLDWRNRVSYIPNISSQFLCGSCWASISISTLEWHAIIHKSIYLQLSEDHLISCSWTYNSGCYGGTFFGSYVWLSLNGGPVASINYGHKRFYPGKCMGDKKNIYRPFEIKKMVYFYQNITVEGLKLILAAYGPVSVMIDASLPSFIEYKDGIYSDIACKSSPSLMNHGLVILGYSVDASGNEYWIGQNSWSTTWGENGYIRISTYKNICGVLNMGMVPILSL